MSILDSVCCCKLMMQLHTYIEVHSIHVGIYYYSKILLMNNCDQKRYCFPSVLCADGRLVLVNKDFEYEIFFAVNYDFRGFASFSKKLAFEEIFLLLVSSFQFLPSVMCSNLLGIGISEHSIIMILIVQLPVSAATIVL